MSITKKIFINRNFYSKLVYLLFSFIFWIKFEIDGIEILKNIDLNKKNYIFVTNHISYLDNFVLAHVLLNIKNYYRCEFIGMDSLTNWFIIGKVLSSLGMIGIKFDIDDKKELLEQNKYSKKSVKILNRKCINTLNKGNSLWIFPEGRCNNHPHILNQIRGGAFNFHTETNVPIIIIGMKNNNIIWPYKGHPYGSAIVKIKVFSKERCYDTIDSYRYDIKNSIEKWINI